MRGAQLERHLVLLAEVDLLAMAALGEVPDVQPVAVLAGEQDLGVDPALHHVRSAPLAGDRGVVSEMPPEVVGELLRASVELPAALHRESVVVDDENAPRRVAVRIAQRADVDSVRAAVNRVRAAVAGPLGDLFGLYRVHELGVLRVGLDVEDVDAGRAQPRHKQIAALEMGMRGIGAQR